MLLMKDGYRVLRRVSSRRGGNFPGGTCGEEDYESRGSCGGRKRMREGQGKADGRKGRTPTYGAISHRECLTGPVLTPETLVRAVLMNTLNMGVVRSASSETLSSHEESHYPVGISSSDAWTLSLSFLSVGVLISAAMALVLLTAVSYQCAATWRWLRTTIIGSDSEASISPTNPSSKTSVMISHSLPDLQSEPAKEEYVQEKETKKVLRQTTLPTVPVRHQTFQRQLSHHLHIPSIQFSICRLEDKSESNLGLIKPELYQLEMERARSSDSSAAVDLEYAGKLHFSLRYDPDIEGLVLKIFEARDLPVKDITGSSDPYIKVYLLPDRKKKFQTKVHRKNLNPVFNETFIFSVNHEDLHQRYLQFSVYDFDRFSRHDLIGQVVLKGLLDTTDLHKEVEYTMTILSPPQEKKHLGELMLSLCYLPTAGRLTLTVVKARNLKAMDITGKSDPYVKIYLLCEGKRMKKKKTTIKKSTLSPVYNEAFVFDVPAENIEDVCLVVKVLDHDRIGSNELLGCTGIGNDFIGVGRDHWLEMLDNPRKPVAQWYPLLDSLPGNFLVEPEPLTVSLGCLNSKERSASPS